MRLLSIFLFRTKKEHWIAKKHTMIFYKILFDLASSIHFPNTLHDDRRGILTRKFVLK